MADLKVYTPKTAGDALSVSNQTILSFITSGELRAYKIGRQWRIKESDLIDFIDRQPSNADPDQIEVDESEGQE